MNVSKREMNKKNANPRIEIKRGTQKKKKRMRLIERKRSINVPGKHDSHDCKLITAQD